jgi:hypothetical protein
MIYEFDVLFKKMHIWQRFYKKPVDLGYILSQIIWQRFQIDCIKMKRIKTKKKENFYDAKGN